jgi:hypothetical protein
VFSVTTDAALIETDGQTTAMRTQSDTSSLSLSPPTEPYTSPHDFINCVTSQSNLLQDADTAGKIAASLKSKILGYMAYVYLTKLHRVKTVNSHVIPISGGTSRQAC